MKELSRHLRTGKRRPGKGEGVGQNSSDSQVVDASVGS